MGLVAAAILTQSPRTERKPGRFIAYLRVRRGELVPEPMLMFVPVQITPEPPVALLSASLAQITPPADDARVEITLPDGTCVRVGTGLGPGNLRRIMTAVRR